MQRIQLILIISFLIIVSYILPAKAEFQGPVEIIKGTWGTNDNQFGRDGDTPYDVFPWFIWILKDEGLIIADIPNGRVKMYDKNGKLIKTMKCIKNLSGEFNEECRFTGRYIETTSEGNILTAPVDNKWKTSYALYSPMGQLLKTYQEMPVIRSYLKYKYIGIDRYIEVFDECGTSLSKLSIQDDLDNHGNLVASYGDLLVGPTGDVFTWKKTDSKYSILQWRWVDRPEKRKQPCENR